MSKLEDFCCIDYEKYFKGKVKGKVADAVCFYIENGSSIKIVIVEKEGKIDPTTNKLNIALDQVKDTESRLELCKENKVKCEKIIVVEKLTQSLARTLRKGLPYIVNYAEISRKQDPSYREKIARFVFENHD